MNGIYVIEIVLSLGVINGLTLATVLVGLKNGNPIATRLFGFALFLISLIILEDLLKRLGIHQSFPHIISSTDGLFLLILPSLYLYGILSTEERKHLRKKDLLHLLPFLMFTIILMPFYSLDGDLKFSQRDDTEVAVLGYLKAFSALIYFPITLSNVIRFKKKAGKDQLPPNNYQNVLWFYRVLILMVIIGVFSLTIFTLGNLGVTLMFDSDIISSLLLTLAFYFNGFVLIKNPYILWGPEGIIPGEVQIRKSQYKNSPLSEKQLQGYLETLTREMVESKSFRNADLTPKELEKLTGIKSHYITQVINTKLGRNFYEFVNAYRVEEVKKLISNPGNNHKTLLALGLEAGFNSKASFNRVFKLYVGQSPSQFKKEKQNQE